MSQRLDAFTTVTGIVVELVEPSDSGGQADMHLVEGSPAQLADRPEVRQFLDYMETGN